MKVNNEQIENAPISEIWVEESQALLSKSLGEDWREKYIVWDCTSDQKKLKNTSKFSSLYRSCAQPKNSKHFEFDFLNDGAHELMSLCPELHKALLSDKPIVFLFDVPLDKSALLSDNTKTKKSMQSFNWGASSRAIYAQYFYRIYIYKKAFQLTNVHIGAFSPSLYLNSPDFKGFRNKFFDEFHYEKGFMFDSSQLDTQKEPWSLSFVHFSGNQPTLSHRFLMELKEIQSDLIVCINTISIYNLDQQLSACEYFNYGVDSLEKIELPEFNATMTVRNTRKKGYQGQMGAVSYDSNSVANNNKDVLICSSNTTRKTNIPILKSNWQNVLPLFTARRSVKRTWENWQYEYKTPDTSHDMWPEFVADSLVYSMFDDKSRQLSLGNVLYNDRVYDIRNHFFWIDPSRLLKMFSNKGFDDFYKDYLNSEIPFFQSLLATLPISKEAQSILQVATDLFEMSVNSRIEMHVNRPELQLHRWDAGFYQMQHVWKKLHKDEYLNFRNQFEVFRSLMEEKTFIIGYLG